MTVAALVFLIVADGHAEGDEATSEPAANKAKNETEDPGECTLLLIDVSHAVLLAVLASDGHGVVGPVSGGVSTHLGLSNHDDGLHHRLTWDRGRLLGSILRLCGHGSVARLLLLDEGLLLGGHAGGDGGAVIHGFLV